MSIHANDREAQSGTVSVRKRGGEDLGIMTLDAFCGQLSKEIAEYGRAGSDGALRQLSGGRQHEVEALRT